MINDKIKKQNSGDNSTNLQAENIVINQGITTTEARDIALDIYKSNFMKLSEEAATIALLRVESFTDKFIKKTFEENVNDKFQSPGLQYALFNAQRECAKSGDKNIEDILSNILVDRAREDVRGLKQIALEESITIIPKLTDKQMNILTLNYLSNESYFFANSINNLKIFLSKWVLPFKEEIEYNSADLKHIEFTGCINGISTSSVKGAPQNNIRKVYAGLFSKGFTLDEYTKDLGSDEKYIKLLIKCLHDAEKYQLNAMSTSNLGSLYKDVEYDSDEKKIIMEYFRRNIMTSEEIKLFFIELEQDIEFIFDLKNTQIFKLELTPVGAAIALANFKHKTGSQLGWPYWMRNA